MKLIILAIDKENFCLALSVAAADDGDAASAKSATADDGSQDDEDEGDDDEIMFTRKQGYQDIMCCLS
jgi:hypothetical protein